MCRKRAYEVEGASHYAVHFAKCTIVEEDDSNQNGSAGTHGDYLYLGGKTKKTKKAPKLKDHQMSSGI